MSYTNGFLLAAVFALAACGGSGTTAVTAPRSAAQLEGAVLEVDGQTLDRDGVDVAIVETGDRIRTSAGGAFRFPDLASGRYTLDFNAPAGRTLALESDEEQQEEEKEQENDGQHEDESDEDAFGRPRFEIDHDGPVVVIKVVLDNGEVIRWSKSHPNHRFVRVRMQRADGAGDTDVRGRIRVREWFRGEREQLRFVACGLSGGDAVHVFLRNATEEHSEFRKAGGAEANGDGCATLAFDTKGGWLPLEAESLSDLAGYDVQIRMAADGTVILNGEIPALPDRVERHEKPEETDMEKEPEEEGTDGNDGEHEEEKPDIAPATYGKDKLIPQNDFAFGSIEVWDWAAKDRQRFRMVAGGLDEDATVRFEMRHPESGEWTPFATRVALQRAEEGDGFIARVDTEWYGVLPLDTEDIEQLIGLGVRVVRETDDGDVVILIGEVPDLIRD